VRSPSKTRKIYSGIGRALRKRACHPDRLHGGWREKRRQGVTVSFKDIRDGKRKRWASRKIDSSPSAAKPRRLIADSKKSRKAKRTRASFTVSIHSWKPPSHGLYAIGDIVAACRKLAPAAMMEGQSRRNHIAGSRLTAIKQAAHSQPHLCEPPRSDPWQMTEKHGPRGRLHREKPGKFPFVGATAKPPSSATTAASSRSSPTNTTARVLGSTYRPLATGTFVPIGAAVLESEGHSRRHDEHDCSAHPTVWEAQWRRLRLVRGCRSNVV